jgi:hypothetical protein
MQSQYLHAVARGQEHRSLTRAFLETPEYIETSRYATQLAMYARCIDRSRLLVITSEALRNDRLATVRRVFEFIGVDPEWCPPNLGQEAHCTRTRLIDAGLDDRVDDRLPAHLERYLRSTLRDEVVGCAPWIGTDFDGWGML